MRVIGDDDHRVVAQERVLTSRRVEEAAELAVGLRDRPDLRVGPELVRVVVVVGQRQQQEVEEIVAHQELAHAAGMLVARPRPAERAPAAGLATGEDVRVEQLARAEHGTAHDRKRGDPRER